MELLLLNLNNFIKKEIKEDIKEEPKKKASLVKIKQELIKEGKEDKIKTTYPDGTVEYRTL